MDAPELTWWDDKIYPDFDHHIVGHWYWDSSKKCLLLFEENKDKWNVRDWHEKWKEHEEELTRFLVVKKLQGEG